MSKPVFHVRSVILSDVHLGTPDSKAEEATHFLKNVRCERLILNGDIIDGWRLRRNGYWAKSHTGFIRHILSLVQKHDVEVTYLRGNHDDFLASFLPMQLERIRFAEDGILETPHGRYLLLHGDMFDGVIKNITFLADLGDMGYVLLLRLNRAYNWFRKFRGKEHLSLSKATRMCVKKAASFIGRFENQVAALANKRGCVGVICGHIHMPADKKIGNIHYLNSGDWIESLTAIVEHQDGTFELIGFGRLLQFAPMSPATGPDGPNDAASILALAKP